MDRNLRTIEFEQVANAYKETGTKPSCGVYADSVQVSPFGALYYQKFGISGYDKTDDAEKYRLEDDIWKWSVKEFGLEYVKGFCTGFDGLDPTTLQMKELRFVEGYNQGQDMFEKLHE